MEKENRKYTVTRTVTPNFIIEETTPVYETKEEYEEAMSTLATEIYRLVNKIE